MVLQVYSYPYRIFFFRLVKYYFYVWMNLKFLKLIRNKNKNTIVNNFILRK